MRVAKNPRRHPLGVLAHLGSGVQARAGVIEIGVAADVEVRVIGSPQVVQRGGRAVLRKPDQEALELRGGHAAIVAAVPEPRRYGVACAALNRTEIPPLSARLVPPSARLLKLRPTLT